MRLNLICLIAILVITGCSLATDRYSISADNVATIRALDSEKISVGEFTSFKPGLKEITCRLDALIKTPDGNTFADYIRKSLIDELQIAEVYSIEAPIILTGHLENIKFSSVEGQWALALTVKSSNGHSILVTEQYEYRTSYDAAVACNQAAQAFMPSVQNLIKNLVTNPGFSNLVKNQVEMEKEYKIATEAAPAEKKKSKLASVPKSVSVPRIELRRKPIVISNEMEIIFMLSDYDFFDRSRNPQGSFKNVFVDNNDGTITDRATGLMWQKSGSSRSIDNRSAKEYVKELNRQRFAGFADWRMPTIEELASLLTRKRQNGVYLDPLFSSLQITCWTVDEREPSRPVYRGGWVVNFKQGQIVEATYLKFQTGGPSTSRYPAGRNFLNYVKAVRQVK